MIVFKKGTRVVYTPTVGKKEFGVVKRVVDLGVFVIYDNACQQMFTGDEPYTAQLTNIEDLEVL